MALATAYRRAGSRCRSACIPCKGRPPEKPLLQGLRRALPSFVVHGVRAAFGRQLFAPYRLGLAVAGAGGGDRLLVLDWGHHPAQTLPLCPMCSNSRGPWAGRAACTDLSWSLSLGLPIIGTACAPYRAIHTANDRRNASTALGSSCSYSPDGVALRGVPCFHPRPSRTHAAALPAAATHPLR